jgi:hypothetical protein
MNKTTRNWLGIIVAGLVSTWALAPVAGGEGSNPQNIEFNRDIRPILSDICFPCHGPDKATRVINLRFDTEAGALADLGGRHAIVPGDLARSEMYQRITAKDEAIRMPPARSGRKLTDIQIDLIRRWIEQGAKWQKHWSFIAPQRPALPEPNKWTWARTAVDSFVLDRLDRNGLTPSPEADRAALIRRVTLDLTGLPPTPAEVDAFLADSTHNAYERVVDRLLASPRYGERMAARWLDGARYADTNGYQSDGERFMWRWRDWVIDAFNRNMPFDRFTIEQIAGDMLPHATLEQKIATGFNRNHRGNAEGGIVPEEYAVEYVVDRVDTTSTVWLGLTLGCARCHDHKYDPITQKEFYQVFAFFNNVPERGKAIKYGNSPPMIKAPIPTQQIQLRELEQKVAAAEHGFEALRARREAAQAAWEKTLDPAKPLHWSISDGLLAHYPLDDEDANGGKDLSRSLKFNDGEPAFVPGRIGRAASFDGRRFVDAGNVADFGFYDKFSLGAWIYPLGEQGGAVLSRMTETARSEGYSLFLEKGKLQLNLSKRWLDDSLRVETERSLTPNRWHHVMATYDGSRVAAGVQIYIDGKPEKLNILLDDLNQSFKVSEPLRIGSLGGPDGRFHGYIDDARVYETVLSPGEVELLATAESVSEIAAIPPDKRSKQQAAKIEEYFVQNLAPEPIRDARRRLVDLRRQKEQFVESIPTTMVMEESDTPKDTHILIRGAYDRPGVKVGPGVPASLPPLPQDAPNNRLGFARWLVDPSNPLTARVAVNRYWQMYFGTGLVKTVDDFGSQGEWPTHPELLDWLATEFVRTGWDVKAMQKTIVMSATYRQSSRVTPELLQKDPENRLFARGPRLRLPSEMIRDQALFAGGLLVEKLGGPSVRPYQPPGLWKELAGGEDYKPDKGENLYRRSLYTFWKRTVAPPAMMTFDAAPRESCVVRETRTNTPLQALALMNDVTYVEASRAMAERSMMQGGATPEERITFAFRLATARRPSAAELQVLRAGFDHHLEKFRSDPKAALKLVSAGDSRRNEKLDPGELAAYTTIAGMILNLDETITR